ncbi:MAG: DUF5916 domain-containing protein [Chitinophagales bacterium]
MHKIYYLLTCLTLYIRTASAQEQYIPLRIDRNLELDGSLDEPEWSRTPVEDAFMQTDPDPGAEPTERTEVRIVYNDTYLYVGITAYDTEADKLVRVSLDRDFNIGNEDGTGFIIDTYHDKITGMNFVTNTLDARWDAQITQDGGGLQDSYNTFWDVRTQVFEWGYSTEYRIPFSSLRFETKEKVVMGFRIARLIKRKNELITFPKCDPNTSDAWTNVSYAREIVFTDLHSRNPLYISPYVIANYAEINHLNAEGDDYITDAEFMTRKYFVDNEVLDKILSNIGIDAKYGLTKNFTLDLSVNTDFAQAEVDDRIINLTKYDVNLPEKRSFFLESANALSFGFPSGNEWFITRKIGRENGVIVPILGGARLTGKANGWQMGVLNMQTAGVESDSIAAHNFFVFRTRKDIDSLGSFVGVLLANKVNTDTSGTSNQSYGFDFVKRINQKVAVEGGIAGTMQDLQTDDLWNDLYTHLGLFRSAKSGLLYTALFDLMGEHVNPVMGFIDDNGYGNIYYNIGYQYQVKKESNIQYIYGKTSTNYRWRTATDESETLQYTLEHGYYFKNGAAIEIVLLDYKIDRLGFDWMLDDQNAIASGVYTMLNTSVYLLSQQQKNYSAGVYSSYGGFYGGKRFSISPEGNIYLTKHASAALTYEYNNIHFDTYLYTDSATLFTSNLVRLSLAYNFSTTFSVKAYIQFEDLSERLTSNLRIRYNPREGTDLFIVLNQGVNSNRDRLDPSLPVIDQQAVTVKFVRTFGQ